ncbi:MAG: response regulator [Azospirillum sp.]|nr:response regulator [Azospirillum sp.]
MAAIEYSKLKVLIVEDESYTRQIIRNLLYQLGVRSIAEAPNGRDGLLELIRVRPDVVLCDVHMKPISGLELLKQLRTVKIPEIAATPVVMLTADSSKDTVMFARELAVNGYLVKPIGLSQLKARIDAAVSDRSLK